MIKDSEEATSAELGEDFIGEALGQKCEGPKETVPQSLGQRFI
jgi:hypothetical protein